MSTCPRDTNGDGNCGQKACPDCGTSPEAQQMREYEARLTRVREARERADEYPRHRYAGLITAEQMADEEQRRAWVTAVVRSARIEGYTGRIRFVRFGGGPISRPDGEFPFGVEIHIAPGCCSAAANRD